MIVQISGESRESDRIRLTAITKRERFGNEAFPSIFWGKGGKFLKNKISWVVKTSRRLKIHANSVGSE